MTDRPAPDAELCVYYEQPGHTPEQKPHPSVWAAGPDEWPMCARCTAIARPTNDHATKDRGLPWTT